MKIIKAIVLLAFFCALAFPITLHARADAPAISAEKQRQLESLFAPWDKKDSPGCVLAVIRDGTIVYQRGYGMADLERGIANSPDSVMDIGSTSKQFTAACVLMLAHRNKLELDAPLRRYIPEIPEYGKPLTVRHLLHHTSGIRDYLTLMALSGLPTTNDYPDEQVLDLIAHQKELNFEPGSEFLYSNSGYFLLAEVVKRVSGQSLRRFAEENIFKPLGMTHTHVHDDFTEIVPHRAVGYSPGENGSWVIDMSNFDVVGDGAVLTTVGDLLLWDRNFYHNTLAGVGPGFLEQLQTVGRLNSGETLDYACGLMVDTYRGLRRVSHGGAWVGYRAQFIRFPELRFSLICLANAGSFRPDAMADKAIDILLQQEFTPPGPGAKETGKKTMAKPRFLSLSVKELSRLIGTFRNPDSGAFWRIDLQEGGLAVKASAGFAFIMKPVGPRTFIGIDTPFPVTVIFEKAKGVTALGLRVQIADRKPQVFEAIELFAPSEAELAAYAGDYHSSELEVVLQVRLRDRQLSAGHRYDPDPAKLQPTLRDEFSASGVVLSFQRDGMGRIVGLTAKAGRVKNIVFKKLNQMGGTDH